MRRAILLTALAGMFVLAGQFVSIAQAG